MSVTRRAVGGLLVAASSVGLASIGLATSVAAQQPAPFASTYSGSASADGARVIYEIPDYLLVERIADAGSTMAQASVNSSDSVGFASAPYPGDTVLSAPDLVSGTVGVPVPGYPFVASSQHPGRPKQEVDQGAVHLSSASTASSSAASSTAGGPNDDAASLGATSAVAEVVGDEATGTVTSAASTSAEAFSVGGVLRIGRVSSTAKVVDTADGDRQRHASLEFGEITIAGQTVALTEEGLALPGSSVPLPDSSPLLQPLADQGIEVRYLAAEKTTDGIVAPSVEVRISHPVPGSPGSGAVVYRLGRAAAAATGGSGKVGLPDTETSPTRADGTPVTAGASPPDPPVLVEAPTARVEHPATAEDTATGGEIAARPTFAPIGAATPQWAKTWTLGLYLVIVFSGVVAVSGSQLIRIVGVRMPWTL